MYSRMLRVEGFIVSEQRNAPTIGYSHSVSGYSLLLARFSALRRCFISRLLWQRPRHLPLVGRFLSPQVSADYAVQREWVRDPLRPAR